MTMKEINERTIKRMVSEGWNTEYGKGNFDEDVKRYERLGYQVYTVYLVWKRDASQREYVILFREKVSKKSVQQPNVDYSSKTTKELKEICKAQAVKGYSKMTKDQMVAALSK